MTCSTDKGDQRKNHWEWPERTKEKWVHSNVGRLLRGALLMGPEDMGGGPGLGGHWALRDVDGGPLGLTAPYAQPGVACAPDA